MANEYYITGGLIAIDDLDFSSSIEANSFFITAGLVANDYVSTISCLVPSNGDHSHSAGSINLSQIQLMAANYALHSNNVSAININVFNQINAGNANHTQSVLPVSLSQIHYMNAVSAQHDNDALQVTIDLYTGIPDIGAHEYQTYIYSTNMTSIDYLTDRASKMVICHGIAYESCYALSTAYNKIATKAMSTGTGTDYNVTNDGTTYTLAIAAKSSLSAETTYAADHVALVSTASSELLFCGPVTSLVLDSTADKINVSTWEIYTLGN